MLSYIIAVSFILIIIGIYVLSYYWDNTTEKPEICEDLECKGCKAQNCSHRK